jgi:hypothetical protein
MGEFAIRLSHDCCPSFLTARKEMELILMIM